MALHETAFVEAGRLGGKPCFGLLTQIDATEAPVFTVWVRCELFRASIWHWH